MRNIKNARAWGIATSYIFMGISAVLNFILTPILVNTFGETVYGDYQFLYAIFGSLSLIDLGFQAITTRYVSIYDCEEKDKERENFLAIIMLFVSLVSAVILALGLLGCFGFPHMFPEKYKSDVLHEILPTVLAMTATSACYLFNRFFQGIAYARNQFAWGSMIQIIQVTLRFCLVLSLLNYRTTILQISVAEFCAVFIATILLIVLSFKKLKIKIKLHQRDRQVTREITSFGSAILIGNFSGFLNEKVSHIILGVMLSSAFVTVFAVSQTVFYNFAILGSNISAVYLTKASTLIASSSSAKQREDFWIAPGRLQLLICGTLWGGFIVLGQEFIALWLGEPNQLVWVTCMVMMLSNVVSVLMDTGMKLVIAQMQGMRTFAWITLGGAVLNVVLSIILVRIIGYVGVLVGAFASNLLMRGVVMNVYMQRYLKINIKRVGRELFRGLAPSFLLAIVATWLVSLCLPSGILFFMLKGILFVVIEAVSLWIFGLTAEEKKTLFALSDVTKRKKESDKNE